jgi:hypothetical protein
MHWSERLECSRGHRYTDKNTYLYKKPNGSTERKCRDCRPRQVFNLCARCGDIYSMQKWEAPWLCDDCRTDDFLDNDPIGQFCVTSG